MRRLGAVKVETQRVPVSLSLAWRAPCSANLFEAVNGTRDLPRTRRSWRANRGEDRVDENHRDRRRHVPGLFGSAPFDDEGVPTRRTPVIENGVLKNYLLNTYTARKLGMRTTGSASRGSPATPASGTAISFSSQGEIAHPEILRA